MRSSIGFYVYAAHPQTLYAARYKNQIYKKISSFKTTYIFYCY